MALPIVDTFGRKHTYLRISLTDKCNLRCTYCMPQEDMQFMPSKWLMQADEISYLAGLFVEMGVEKIRLTGGEPLVRKDAGEIISTLGKLPASLTLTTNAVYIDQFIPELKAAGVTSLNVSLDTLREERFRSITKRDHFGKTLDHIRLLLGEGFVVKVNMVVMRGTNDDEVNDFVRLTLDEPNLHVRFIEFMPFKGNQWDMSKIVSYSDLLTTIGQDFEYRAVAGELHDTARRFQVNGGSGTFGIIGTVTHPFCEGCNRIRLTADGKLKNCLFDTSEVDLLTPLRQGDDVRPLIYTHFQKKHFAHGGHASFSEQQAKSEYEQNREMIAIGG
ncbi:MAG: cyclic pyranopterin phosphate synthase MoaA [Dyadobacter sp. 50-39]|uniref:GTP 3',8-cyclase MoaA n=1 Tax=Dyadobacter sp. 50-39 TaxID=1895756 RepID=UPI00095AAEC9|nr:GTP 3',8-cyclase MoaA [Dyadobacter sp. 50-39]OJV17512.1 MAG: cyclic pyranopterin phosphate synthase MoaA [Dyadobacter sp. 50-39]